MREILYKAKDFFTNEWVYGVPIKDSEVKGKWWMIQSCTGPLTDDTQVKRTIVQPETICISIIISSEQTTPLFQNDRLLFCGEDGQFEGVLIIEDNDIYLKDGPLRHDIYSLKHWIESPEFFTLKVIGNTHDEN